MRVILQGETVYDTLGKEIFAGSPLNTIPLHTFEQEQDLEIIYIQPSDLFFIRLPAGKSGTGANIRRACLWDFLYFGGSGILPALLFPLRGRIPQGAAAPFCLPL